MSTKEKVLEELNKLKKGSSVSGEELARLCGVSRAAVWKAVNSLRSEGCSIQGTTNGGYVLNGPADVFSKENFKQNFKIRFPEFSENHVECFKEIDSTNTYAKKLLSVCSSLRDQKGNLTEEGRKFNGAVFVAQKQTAGRGRSGRTFVSPEGTGIYLSVTVVPEGGVTNPARFTAFSAVAVCRAIKKLYRAEPSIKWINDIFLNGKKICGILTEGSANFETGMIESAIIGIGINIEPNEEFEKNGLSKTAGSIISSAEKSEIDVTRSDLAAQVAGEVLHVLEENPETVIDEYKSLSFIIGKKIDVHPLITSEETYRATAVDITGNAELVVECEDGTRRTLSAGEVSLKSENFA